MREMLWYLTSAEACRALVDAMKPQHRRWIAAGLTPDLDTPPSISYYTPSVSRCSTPPVFHDSTPSLAFDVPFARPWTYFIERLVQDQQVEWPKPSLPIQIPPILLENAIFSIHSLSEFSTVFDDVPVDPTEKLCEFTDYGIATEKTVTTSSTEAELLALKHGAKQIY